MIRSKSPLLSVYLLYICVYLAGPIAEGTNDDFETREGHAYDYSGHLSMADDQHHIIAELAEVYQRHRSATEANIYRVKRGGVGNGEAAEAYNDKKRSLAGVIRTLER